MKMKKQEETWIVENMTFGGQYGYSIVWTEFSSVEVGSSNISQNDENGGAKNESDSKKKKHPHKTSARTALP